MKESSEILNMTQVSTAVGNMPLDATESQNFSFIEKEEGGNTGGNAVEKIEPGEEKADHFLMQHRRSQTASGMYDTAMKGRRLRRRRVKKRTSSALSYTKDLINTLNTQLREVTQK